MNDNNMLQEIPQNELIIFKQNVRSWLDVDKKIESLNTELKQLKKQKNKEIEPQMTEFMVKYNIKDLNTDTGKLKCNELKTKKAINKTNLTENLSTILEDQNRLNEAVDLILTNREINIKYKIVKGKR
jgi:hypothetical protein